MRIIPVLDLMGGQVVQGHQGDRAHYQPVSSVLTGSCEPLQVATALRAATGSNCFYLADLDAIEGRGDHRSEVQELADALEAELWVDGGATDAISVAGWLEAGAGRVVIGSETLDSMQRLHKLRARYPADRLVFSLDVQQGHVLSARAEFRETEPLELLARVVADGWTHVILLTLDRVGTGSGPDWGLLERARRAHPNLSLMAGGGVRSMDDLEQLSRLGVSGVLLASALHRGWVTEKEVHALTSGSVDLESSPAHGPGSERQKG